MAGLRQPDQDDQWRTPTITPPAAGHSSDHARAVMNRARLAVTAADFRTLLTRAAHCAHARVAWLLNPSCSSTKTSSLAAR
ncbi:hypothetical protein R1CP_40010 (plasmid) [Rhodococcus opacus]|uniref:Uncharacterized protein n=1 Tax=Rhodococcus opacus TaxID=37919 RepID=A0A1B1KJ10_RHOOP|nr:hypothetical protein R1CP_40010 [Rhodococcus opacus]